MLKKIIKHKYTSSFILAAYAVLLFIGVAHHEMWMDESHHWLVARESSSLVELLNNYRYDGHPLLWILIMFAFSFLSENSLIVQYVHGLIAFISIIIFTKKAPFSNYFKFGFILSYFPLYEYGMITRNYSILMLCLFCLPLYYKTYKQSFFKVCAILGLIANTHFFGLIFSLIFGGVILVKVTLSKSVALYKLMLGSALLGLMLLFSVYSILPPSDNPFVLQQENLISFSKFADALMLFFKALVPIPDLGTPFYWNTNMLTSHLKWFIAPIALLSWLIPIILSWRSRWLLLVWYAVAGSIISVFLITELHAGVRYGGVLILFLIALKWMDNVASTVKESIHMSNRFSTFKNALIGFLLTVHVSSGIFHVISDINRPFSATKTIYEFLTDNGYQDYPLTSNAFCNCISIRNYYTKPLYFLNLRDSLTFCEWNQLHKARGLNRQFNLSRSIDETILYMINRNLNESILLYHGEDIFIDSTDISRDPSLHNVKHLTTIKNGIVKRENYAVYLIQR